MPKKKAETAKTPRKAPPRLAKRSVTEAPPPEAVEIAKRLQKKPGVVCVTWGARRTRGRWFRGLCLSVHVKKKLPASRLGKRCLPKEVDGIRIDVIEVGTPEHHSLSVQSPIDAGALGISTATVMAKKGADAVALLSGHGTSSAGSVAAGTNGESFVGTVAGGAFGSGLSVDWAFATFGGEAQSTSTRHPAANATAPLPLAVTAWPGDKLRQFSVSRGKIVEGILQGTVMGEVVLEGETYTSLLSIVSTKSGGAFSVPGDSGSLIVDGDGRAVAAVVGGKTELNVFYAYDLRRLASAMSPSKYSLFFEDP